MTFPSAFQYGNCSNKIFFFQTQKLGSTSPATISSQCYFGNILMTRGSFWDHLLLHQCAQISQNTKTNFLYFSTNMNSYLTSQYSLTFTFESFSIRIQFSLMLLQYQVTQSGNSQHQPATSTFTKAWKLRNQIQQGKKPSSTQTYRYFW